MYDPPILRISEFLRGIVKVLWNHPEGQYARDVIDYLPKIIELTEHETGISSHFNMPRYERMARLATLSLMRVGWMAKTDKGLWFLTADGRNACRKFQNSKDLFLEAVRLSEEIRTDSSEIAISFDMIQEMGWDMVANFIHRKNKAEIRKLIMALLEAMQFHLVWMAHPQKDHGLIDAIASTDPIGGNPYRILIHVKHTGQPVTVEGLKSFQTILGLNDFGLFFSTGGFTAEAQNEINKGASQKINAMDLQKFYDMWIKYFDKLSNSAHQILPLKAIFFIYPQE